MKLENFLTTVQAARVLNLTVQRVIQLEREHKLHAIRIGHGWRLFDQRDVEEFQRRRDEKRAEPQPAA
jgi:excisionase family DNA binding protein